MGWWQPIDLRVNVVVAVHAVDVEKVRVVALPRTTGRNPKRKEPKKKSQKKKSNKKSQKKNTKKKNTKKNTRRNNNKKNTKKSTKKKNYGAERARRNKGRKAPYKKKRAATPRKSGGSSLINITNLDHAVTEADVREIFSKIGKVKKAVVMYNAKGKSRGVALVTF